MMKLLYIILILGITACSSQKEMMLGTVVPEGQANLINDKEMFQMSRQETVTAIQDCHSAGLRAVMYHSKVRLNAGKSSRYIPIVVQVLCAPQIK